MILHAPAKINLGIEILRRRPDGYHDIETLFQSIDLCDDLEIEALPGTREVRLSGDDPAIPWDERNLIFKAARLLQDESAAASGARIRVRKRVPAGKGLGGGSSDAAATLWALDRLWGLGLPPERLSALSARLGADVPYFLSGGLCLGTGRGDVLEPLPDPPPLWCALALPPFPVLTADVYRALPAALTSPGEPGRMIRFLEAGDFRLLRNQLEEAIFRAHPGLADIKRHFRDRGAVLTLVSGSGSAVFGLFPERTGAEAALAGLAPAAAAVAVPTLSRERYWARLQAGV